MKTHLVIAECAGNIFAVTTGTGVTLLSRSRCETIIFHKYYRIFSEWGVRSKTLHTAYPVISVIIPVICIKQERTA